VATSASLRAHTVSMGLRPPGSSSSTERSKSPKTTMAAVRGIGVAVMTSRSGSISSVERERPFSTQCGALLDAKAVLLVK